MPSPIIDESVTPDFQAMTMAQLRAEFARLAAVVALATEHRRIVGELIERRQALVAAQVKLDQMSDAEKDALRDLLAR